MAIIRWDPFRDLMTLREKMNRLFEEAFITRGEEKELFSGTWTPSIDIYETEHALILSAAKQHGGLEYLACLHGWTDCFT